MNQRHTAPIPDLTELRLASASAVLLRFVGVAILLAGLYSGFLVVQKVWTLFDEHEGIARFAERIEEHSNLNEFVGRMTAVMSLIQEAGRTAREQPKGEPEGKARGAAQAEPRESGQFNASYFAGWALSIILLFLIARISLWAVTAGGKLALYSVDQEVQLKLILRELIAELRGGRQSH